MKNHVLIHYYEMAVNALHLKTIAGRIWSTEVRY